MTTGNFERGDPKELPEVRFRADDISPETIDSLKRGPAEADFMILGGPGSYSFVELTPDEEAREAFKPVPTMTEKCTIRSTEQRGVSRFLDEQNVPQACIDCLQKAILDGRISRTITDTRAEAASALEEDYGYDNELDDDDQWQSTSFGYSPDSADRIARIETGYDIHTESYNPSTIHTTEDIIFQCEND